MRTARSSPYGGLCPGDLPDRDPLDGDPPWRETPQTKDPSTKTPLGGRPHRRNMGSDSQTGSDIIQRLSLPIDRMTDTRLWKNYLAQATFADGN